MFTERFRVARARAKMTLRDTAKIVGASPQAVKKYEDGLSMPSSGKLLKICEAFDVSIEWLLSAEPLDFRSTESAPEGRHAKYWVRECIAEMKEQGFL